MSVHVSPPVLSRLTRLWARQLFDAGGALENLLQPSSTGSPCFSGAGHTCSISTSSHLQASSSNSTALVLNKFNQKVPYSVRSGTPPPAPWPVLERVKKAPATGEIKWHRSLYRFPDEVQVELHGRELSLTGRAGTVRLDLRQLDPSGLVAFKMMSLGPFSPPTQAGNSSTGARHMMAVATPDKERFNSFISELEASVRGVSVGYLVGMTVKGVGYRMEPMDEAPRKNTWYFEDDKGEASTTAFPHPKPVPAVRLKVGYSRTAVFPFPPGIRAFCIKPTLLYLYGLRKEEVDSVAATLRAIRKPNVYTGNGIQRIDEVVRIKQRKASK